MSETETKLTGKQKAFIAAYLGTAHFNATKAAEMAGYSGDSNALSQRGFELVRNSKIQKLIDDGLANMSMSANEVIARLNQIARGKITDVLDEEGNFDLKGAKKFGKDGLIKKLKRKRTLKQKKTEIADSMQSYLAEDEINDLETETEIIFEEVEFELYSSHEALRDLGKYHKLFTDRTEVEANVNLKSVEEFNKESEERIKKIENQVRNRE